MKTLLSIAITLMMCVACGPEDAAPEVPIDDMFNTENATLLKSGMFIGVGHTASGTASLYEADGSHVVVLDPYSSQNGPDLKIYLSKDPEASEYLRLGPLKSTMGKQSYNVPSGTNLDNYPYVLVWCEKFSVLFAQAKLD